jgi:hypothetical protein
MRERISPAVPLAGALSGALVTVVALFTVAALVVALFTVVALLLIGGGAVNGPPWELYTINLLQALMLLFPGPRFSPCALEASLACLGGI